MVEHTMTSPIGLASILPDDEIILTYNDLPAVGIDYCRVHLNRLIAQGKFPAAVRVSANRIAWRLSAVREFLRNRETIVPAEPRRHTEAAKQKMRQAWATRRRKPVDAPAETPAIARDDPAADTEATIDPLVHWEPHPVTQSEQR
jgi:hypothetical protein